MSSQFWRKTSEDFPTWNSISSQTIIPLNDIYHIQVLKKLTSKTAFARKASKNIFCQNKGINQEARCHGIQEIEDGTKERGEKNSQHENESKFQDQSKHKNVYIGEW